LYDDSEVKNKPKNPKPTANKKAATSSINFTPKDILGRNTINHTTAIIQKNLYFACNILKIDKGTITCFSIKVALMLNANVAKLAGKANMAHRKNSLIKKVSFSVGELANCI
jgi:hypothetical protein